MTKLNDHDSNAFLNRWIPGIQRAVEYNTDGSSAIISVRFNHPVKDLWEAWTDPAALSKWFAKVNGQIKAGSEVAFDVGAPNNITAEILEYRFNESLRFTWYYPGRMVDEISISFSNADPGLLELRHFSKDPTNWWYGSGSGWESALIRLQLLLDGYDTTSISNEKLDEVLGPLWLKIGEK